jgi:hypothetical protein
MNATGIVPRNPTENGGIMKSRTESFLASTSSCCHRYGCACNAAQNLVPLSDNGCDQSQMEGRSAFTNNPSQIHTKPIWVSPREASLLTGKTKIGRKRLISYASLEALGDRP